MKELVRIKMAKVVFCLAGWLTLVKTYQRTYEWMGVPSTDDDDNVIWENKEFEYNGRVWLPCHLSIVLLERAERIDPVHFDHWALKHIPGDVCAGGLCQTCGGHVHPQIPVDLNGEVTPS